MKTTAKLIMVLFILVTLESCFGSQNRDTITTTQSPTSTNTPENTLTPTSTITPTSTTTPIPEPPLLQIDGKNIIDEEGNIVILRGVAIMDPILLGSGWNPDLGLWRKEIFQTLHDWGANLVRLPIHPPIFFDYGIDDSLLIIDQAIAWSEEYQLYVILDFHGLGFPPDGYDMHEFAATTEDEMIQFWDLVSERYQGNNTVAFYQYYNEPSRNNTRSLVLGDWLIWKEFSEGIIDVIRANDPETIIIVSGMKGGNDLSFVPDAPIDREKILYEVHPFPGQYRWASWDRVFGRTAEDYPVIVEFGFDNDPEASHFLQESNFTGPGIYREEIMKYIKDRGLSWTGWVFSHDWTPRMLEDTDYTPSEFGQFIKDQFQIYLEMEGE